MATELFNLDNSILYSIKKIKKQHQRADIERIFVEVTKTIEFQDLSKISVQDRVDYLLNSNKIVNKINRNQDSFFLNEDNVDMTVLDMIPYTQHSPSNNQDTPDIFLETIDSTPLINTQTDLLETPKKTHSKTVTSDIDQSVLYNDEMFEEVKFNKLKAMILNQIKNDIKALVKSELRQEKTTLTEISNDALYQKEISMLRDELKTKEFIIKDLLNTIKEIKGKPVIPFQPIPSYIDGGDTDTTIIPVEESDNINKIVSEKDSNSNKSNVSDENAKNHIRKSIEEQLNEVIKEKQEKYYKNKISNNATSGSSRENDSKEKPGKYPDGTTVVLGDSILNGVIQEKLSRPGRPVKVHNFRGATVDDMKYHVIPIIRKEPTFVILHIGTNDSPHSTSQEILDKTLELKSLINKELPNCKVVISTPTIRSDNRIAALTVSQLTNKLLELDVDTIDNRNINNRNLGNKGLHLNQTGTSRLAKNFLSCIKGF